MQGKNIAMVCETSAKNDINVKAVAKGLQFLLLQDQGGYLKRDTESLYFYSMSQPDVLQTVSRELVKQYSPEYSLAKWSVTKALSRSLQVIAVGSKSAGRTILLSKLPGVMNLPPPHSAQQPVNILQFDSQGQGIVPVFDLMGGLEKNVADYVEYFDVAIVTMDCSNPNAFSETKLWLDKISFVNKDESFAVPIILVITKADLVAPHRVITLEQTLQWCIQAFAIDLVCETSALDNVNLHSLAKSLQLLLFQNRTRRPGKFPSTLYFYESRRPDQLQLMDRRITMEKWGLSASVQRC